jgi:hypothetical protein
MPGKTNLKEILQNINPYLLDESFVFITSCEPIEDLVNLLNPKATFLEDEGMTLVISQKDADKHSLQYDSVFKCISLGVHSSLESYGLISTITHELSKHRISSNIFSGFFHDHIFVQTNMASEALKVISSMGSS